MEKNIQLYIESLKKHEPQEYKNMKIIPLMGPDNMLEYLVLDEALKQGLKAKETGTVQKLHLNNGTGKEILILQGEYILGGAQNRMMSQNIYLSKNYNGNVPVNCVQRGRWTVGIPKKFDMSPDRVARKVYLSASKGQGEVWNTINSFAADYNARSSTEDYDEIKNHQSGNIEDYLNHFQNVSGAVGMAIAIDNKGQISYSIDIFDQSGTLDKHFRKLLKSYATEAVLGGSSIQHEDIDGFLSKINSAQAISQKAVSLGKDFRIEGEDIEGSALLLDDLPIYINVGTRYDSGREVPHFNTEIFRPSTYGPRSNPWRRDGGYPIFPGTYIREWTNRHGME